MPPGPGLDQGQTVTGPDGGQGLSLANRGLQRTSATPRPHADSGGSAAVTAGRPEAVSHTGAESRGGGPETAAVTVSMEGPQRRSGGCQAEERQEQDYLFLTYCEGRQRYCRDTWRVTAPTWRGKMAKNKTDESS